MIIRGPDAPLKNPHDKNLLPYIQAKSKRLVFAPFILLIAF